MKFAERYQDILKRNKAFLDMHLTNRCNLNCCCQRLSHLWDSETDYTFNEFKNDFDKILKFPDFNELEVYKNLKILKISIKKNGLKKDFQSIFKILS